MASLIKYYPIKINSFIVILFSLFWGQEVASAQDTKSINDLNQSYQILYQIEASRFAVRKQLEASRNQRDIVKTLCISDKLNQIDIAIRSLKDNKFDLKMAINQNNANLASHKFIIVSLLYQKINQFTVEANQCISREQDFVGKSSIKSYIQENISQNYYPNFEEIIIQPPTCYSCFK
jgi:hypothetical protein